MVSGGEANVVETCTVLTKLLEQHGAPSNILSPAFGMTETSGGSIYSKDFPRRDIERGNEFAIVGSCNPSMHMRITDDCGEEVGREVSGSQEVRGPIVFHKYYNDPMMAGSSLMTKAPLTP